MDYLSNIVKSNVLLYVVIGVLLIKIVSVAFYLPISQNFFFADITKIDLLNLLNENRQSLGLKPLIENENLNQAAYLKAQDMIKNGYFAHKSPQGITPWFWFGKAGYTYKYAGENLAVGFLDSKTVYDAWSNSATHKENLLNSHYTEVGTAVVSGFEGNSILVVQEFGSPLSKAPVVTKTATTKVAPLKKEVPAQITQKVELPQPEQPAPLTQTPKTQNSQISKVLGQSTEYIVKPTNTSNNSLYLRFLNFVVYEGSTLLQYLSYALLIVLLLYFFMASMLIFETQNKAIITRSLLLVGILAISIVLNKDILTYIFPYQITI